MLPDSPAIHNKTLTPPPSLQPRRLPIFALLNWEHMFHQPGLVLIIHLGAVLPCIACIYLYRVFSQILDNVLTIWAHSPPSNQVVLEAGNLRIEFGCTKEPVPVDFIAEFAASRRDAVERGFAPLFAREWWWDRRGRVCYAGLRVVEGRGVAIPPFD